MHYSTTPHKGAASFISQDHTNDHLHIGQSEGKYHPSYHLYRNREGGGGVKYKTQCPIMLKHTTIKTLRTSDHHTHMPLLKITFQILFPLFSYNNLHSIRISWGFSSAVLICRIICSVIYVTKAKNVKIFHNILLYHAFHDYWHTL